MEDLERRVILLEEKAKSELGDEGDDGQVWRCIDSQTTRLSKIEDIIWKGNGDSLTTQIVKLRTELRTLAVVATLLIPVVMKALDLWLEKS